MGGGKEDTKIILFSGYMDIDDERASFMVRFLKDSFVIYVLAIINNFKF